MYRPLLPMPSDHRQKSSRNFLGSEESKKPEPATKGRGSKKSSAKKAAANPKKPTPKRGVGVAQLERLRLQQRWKKLTQMPLLPSQPQAVQNTDLSDQNNQFQYYQNPSSRPDPLHSIPVLYGASNYNGPLNGSSGLVVQGVNGSGGSAGFGYGYNIIHVLNDGGGNLVLDPNPYSVGAGAPNSEAVYEISNELSTKQKMKQQGSCSSSSEYCCCCKQEKKYNCGNNVGFDGSPAVLSVIDGSPVYSRSGFNGRATPAGSTYLAQAGPSLVDESVEIKAVHRKGKQAGGDIMMEYKFFPDHNNNSSSTVSSVTYPMEERDFVASSVNSSSAGRSQEAHSDHNKFAAAAAATCIDQGADMMMMSSCYSPVDLSLKLSF